jgi:MFS family permease
MTVLLVLAAVTAAAAGVRSTWSPCGISMLSSITPLSERGRGHRFAATASWFLVGAVAGGLTLGALAALGALAISAVGLSATTPLGVAAVAAVITAGIDLHLVGPALPHHRRQVNEVWLDQYRAWVYGAGFGWQIGSGLTTYIMTAAVYLTIVLAALTASPVAALGIGLLFGVVRGSAVWLGRGITTPAALSGFHRRFDALGEPVRRTVAAVQVAVVGAAVVASGSAWALVAVLATGALVAGASFSSNRRANVAVDTDVPAVVRDDRRTGARMSL